MRVNIETSEDNSVENIQSAGGKCDATYGSQ